MSDALDPHAEAWWEATRDRRPVLQHCTACRRFQHFPRAICIGCGGDMLEFRDATGRGVVDSFTTVLRADEPYTVARVRLAEGPIRLTHLEGIANPVCDQPVRVAWRPLPSGRHLPVFRSADDGL
jgi:hypothetical protein